ncbi:MAG: FIST N-terminal domain-containing protein, partial [Desulfobacteraceae bacterium]
MKVGIGCANETDGLLSGRIVAENAIKDGKIVKPGLVIAFCSGDMDHYEYFTGLKTIVGDDVPIVGGSAVGVITNKNLSYDGSPAGAAIIEAEDLHISLGAAGDLDKNEKAAGQKLGEKLSKSPEGNLLLLFYDSIKKAPTETSPPVINAS